MGNMDLQEPEKLRPVRDYVLETGEWNWEDIAGKVNHSVMQAIASIRPPDVSINLEDFLVWIGSKDGNYSTSVTYKNLIAVNYPT